MKLEFSGDCDLQYWLGVIGKFNVRIDGTDYFVSRVRDDGLDVRPIDDDGAFLVHEDQFLEWDSIEEIFVY